MFMFFIAFSIIVAIGMVCAEKGRINAKAEFRKKSPELAEEFQRIFKS